MNLLPAWFKQELPAEASMRIADMLASRNVCTVCREAKCPNINACFRKNTATFMILGDVCTRNCAFCAIKKTGKVSSTNAEPILVAEAVKRLGLQYAVITSVTRDDLSDGGAKIFAATIESIRKLNLATKVEVLIPDFKGHRESIKCVVAARPDVLSHNMETVERLYPQVRAMAEYRRSLDVLKLIKEFSVNMITKSSLMLGLGETEEEIIDTMKDLRYSKCDILTLGQYLSPGSQHYPVQQFIAPEQFKILRNIGLELGFKVVLSGPLVRSSYQAEEVFQEVSKCMM